MFLAYDVIVDRYTYRSLHNMELKGNLGDIIYIYFGFDFYGLHGFDDFTVHSID